jgi:hypothetical protein
MVTDTGIGAAPPSGSVRAYCVGSAATEMTGGWSSKNTWCGALVERWPDELAAETVNSTGDVPSDGPAGRGKLKLYVSPLWSAPGCAQAPVSPWTRRQRLAPSTPALPVMLAMIASGAPEVSKNVRPSPAVKPAGVATVTFEIRGASVATQTRCARSQAAPDEQSASFAQDPRLDVRQPRSVAQSKKVNARMEIRRRR